MLNVEKNKDQIEKIVEKIQFFMGNNSFETGNKILGAATGAAIYAGKEVFKGSGGGRVMIFSCNQCASGYGNSKSSESLNLLNTENEKNIYIPKVNFFV